MGFLKSNFRTTPKGKYGTIKSKVAVDAAKLAGSIIVFKRGKDFVIE